MTGDDIVDLRHEMETLREDVKAMRKEIFDALVETGARADNSWMGFGFTITYVLLALILWRIW